MKKSLKPLKEMTSTELMAEMINCGEDFIELHKSEIKEILKDQSHVARGMISLPHVILQTTDGINVNLGISIEEAIKLT